MVFDLDALALNIAKRIDDQYSHTHEYNNIALLHQITMGWFRSCSEHIHHYHTTKLIFWTNERNMQTAFQIQIQIYIHINIFKLFLKHLYDSK